MNRNKHIRTATGILWDASEELGVGGYSAATLDEDELRFQERGATRYRVPYEPAMRVALHLGDYLPYERRVITDDNVEEEYGVICRWVYQGLLP